MKKVIVCFAVAAFVFVPSLQAGEKKAQAASAKSETSCSAKSETVAKSEAACGAKTSCCANSKAIAKRSLKGAALLALR
jgi:hypothetical protein